MKRKKIGQPLQKGVARVPVVMQQEALECGAACLTMILGYYGKWITLEQARVDCGVSRDGSNAKNIVQAARSYGLETHAYRLDPKDLMENGSFPCILHWGLNHFVVLDGFRGKKAVLNDPARGCILVSMEEFDRKFTGICLTMSPGENFSPAGKRKSIFDYSRERLAGSGSAVLFVTLIAVIAAMMGFIKPVFSRIFLDYLLTGKKPEWQDVFLNVLIAFCVLSIILDWIKAVYNLRIQGKMAVVGNTAFLWKVLRLPMQFFFQRRAGDLAARQETNASIVGTLVNTLAPILIDTAMMVFYLVVMLRYSLLLTAIGIGTILLNIFVSWIVSQKRINITRAQLRDEGKLSSMTVSGINMIETLKSSGAEEGYFDRWSGLQASVNAQKVRYTNLNQWIGMIPEFCVKAADLAVLGIGIALVIRGEFTIGMVMAFQGFLASFMTPASSLVTAAQSVQEMVTQMERIDDVMNYPEDPCFDKKEKKPPAGKLSGHIKIDNITFGYSLRKPPLIENFSMEIHPGEKIAFVGCSGCGKSTLAKLLSGLYQPWSGEITFDGMKIDEIDRDVFTGSVAVIDQDVTLFSDTIAENIRLWDPAIENFEVIMAARDADIHDDIIMKEGGYQHRLQEDGKDLSGGQRQRMEIARALVQDPTICILDEATSALDVKTEQEVVRAIANRGITCIVIAHRLSTIRDCDQIVVLDCGKAVERGTHRELMELGGVYTRLVTSE